MARKKVTKDEYKKRIMLVSRKIVEGENTTELAENISIQFSVTVRQAWNYIRDAKEQLVAISVDSKEALFAEHIAVRRGLLLCFLEWNTRSIHGYFAFSAQQGRTNQARA